jgi:hypothetical protein
VAQLDSWSSLEEEWLPWLPSGYVLHRTGHHKLERAFPIYASGDSAYGVAYSFAHR